MTGYEQPVVGPISFSVSRGEPVALTGDNGAGKTTILRAIIGTARIFEGHVARSPMARASVLRQFPEHAVEMPLLASELLAVTGASRQAVPEVVEPLLHTRLDRLSGGQYQLLMVWACLGSTANLVLLDEPTNNMDDRTITALATLIGDARQRGQGVLIVSHDSTFLSRVEHRPVHVVRRPRE